jgi:hypothetical protein
MCLIFRLQQRSGGTAATRALSLMAGCATYAPLPLNKSSVPNDRIEQLDQGGHSLSPELGLDVTLLAMPVLIGLILGKPTAAQARSRGQH